MRQHLLLQKKRPPNGKMLPKTCLLQILNLARSISQPKPVITNVGTALSATLSADYEPLFPFLLETKVSALSEVDMGNSGKTEIVFVLDYSSSMNSKYAVMRDAVVSVINQVTNNQTNPDTKIGLVPFARQVYATMDGKYVLGGTTGVPWTNCTIDRKYPWVWKDQTPTGATDSKWGRTDSNDTIESDEYDDCPNYPSRNLVIRPLSNMHADTVAQMSAMTPYSGTNIALGMEFGYQVISPEAPWTEGAEYDDSDVRKYIVLLSDGRHNKKGFGPGNQFSVERGRWNLEKVCSELKKNSVEVITIAYDLDDSEGKDELKSCATSSSRYYFEGDESNILEIFGDVGRLVSNMRLTK